MVTITGLTRAFFPPLSFCHPDEAFMTRRLLSPLLVYSIISACVSTAALAQDYWFPNCTSKAGASKTPKLNPENIGHANAPSGSTNGEVQFSDLSSPFARITNGNTPTAVRVCTYDRSNALAVSILLTNGSTQTSGVQERNCRDLISASVSVGPSCWWRRRGKRPVCGRSTITQECNDGSNLYRNTYYSYGWVQTSDVPSLDDTFRKKVDFQFAGISFGLTQNFYILNSEITQQIEICTAVGTRIFYDQVNPFGTSQTNFVSTLPCTTLAAKSVWFSGRSNVQGSYQIFY
jgi:hypothetical protein